MFQGRAGIALAFILGLAIATAGTATAAKLITGKQIQNGSIAMKDLSKDVRAKLGKTGAQGSQGDPGPTGAPGSKGDRGVSAWETIPSGVTIRGSEAIGLPSDGIGAGYTQTISLGARAPVGLLNATVNFAADGSAVTTDDDATCTGSNGAPAAPPGKVCIYPSSLDNVSGASGVAHTSGGEYSYRLVWSAAAAAPTGMFMTFTWAYTAP
jgi:hypothetical protein